MTVPAKYEPEIGLSPIELYFKNEPGDEDFKVWSWHTGNRIIEIGDT